MSPFVEAVPIAGGIVGAGVEALDWRAPLRPDDQLNLRRQIVEVTPSESRPGADIGSASESECVASLSARRRGCA